MSGLKSVIITLPAKGLTTTSKTTSTPSIITTEDLVNKQNQKLNFTTSILMDKIKMENSKKLQPVKHIELSVPVVTSDNVILKQENLGTSLKGKKRRLDHLTWEEKLQRK